jgi:hypothetical protein
MLFLLLLGISCAKIEPITGGPVDEEPPKLVKAEPPVYSTNFNKSEIKIYFDEFVQLKSLNQKLLVSPPMKNKPKVTLKGKFIEVNLEDELYPNTTYTLNFGDAIVDNNEGNPIPRFEYVFSTGDKLDSISLSGYVVDAFTNEPVEDAYAMVYDTIRDSIPLQHPPYYVSKTDEKGFFRVRNMKNDTFKIFILKDMNMNYMYDNPEESIAFIDTLVRFQLEEKRINDSLGALDSLAADSLMADSLVPPAREIYWFPELQYRLFNEETDLQYLSSAERPGQKKLQFIFNRSLFDTAKVEFLYREEQDWFLKEMNPARDSMIYWITDSNVYNADTFSLALRYHVLEKEDTVLQTDTVFLQHFPETETGGLLKKESKFKKKEDKLKLGLSQKRNGKLKPHGDIIIRPEHPIGSMDTTKIILWQKVDTLQQKIPVHVKKDSQRLRKYRLWFDWTEAGQFTLELLPGAFTDIYGTGHDTLKVPFSTPKLEEFGTIITEMRGITMPMIVQVMDQKNKVVREQLVTGNGKIHFRYMRPATYVFKAIFDENGNGKWDTGDYFQKKQPERVIYFNKTLQLRANWDLEEVWDVQRITAMPKKQEKTGEELPEDKFKR